MSGDAPTGVLNADADALRRYYLFRPCLSQQELHDWIVAFLGIDFPGSIVDPDSNSSPMGLIWEVYHKCLSVPGEDEGAARYLCYASRSGYKTLAAAVIEVLALLHLGRDVAHMAAIEGQATKAQSYVKEAFRRALIRDFVTGDNERMLRLLRYYDPTTGHSLTESEYHALSVPDKHRHEKINHIAADSYNEHARYVKVVICSMAGANSEHVPLFIADELDVIANPAAFQEAKSIPSARDGMIPVTVFLSTRKSAVGLVQKEIDNAKKSGLQIRHWNVIDVTRRCEPKRHRPDLPRLPLYVDKDRLHHTEEAGYQQLTAKQQEGYVRDPAAYAGCAKCKLYPMCRGALATRQESTSKLLNTIPVTIDAFGDKDIDYAQAQLLCNKPSQKGKIYARFDKLRHILTPAQAYEKVFGESPGESLGGAKMTKAKLTECVVARELPWGAGMDYGDTHEFVFALGFRDGARGFLMRCPAGVQLEPDQQIKLCEPFEYLRPDVWPDTANPGLIRMFKKLFTMRKWAKNAGSIASGISVVQAMLSPILSEEPDFYIVHDIDEDPEIDHAVDQVQDYSWKLDAVGNPTGLPNKVRDDVCDGIRYWLMNMFGKNSGVAVSKETEERPALPVMSDVQAAEEVMQRAVAQATGLPFQPTMSSRRMTVEAPEGSGFQSYYAEDAPAAPAKPRGKKGGLVWDLG